MPRPILPVVFALTFAAPFAMADAPKDLPATAPVALTAQAANRFTFAYLAAAERSVPSRENFVASPLGVYLALSLARAGATGETREAISTGLFYPKAPAASPDIRAFVGALHPGAGDAVTRFDIASAVFADSTRVKLNPEYVRLAANDFDAGVAPVDFSKPPAACAAMNAWIKEKTHGKIPAMISPAELEPSVSLVLANAVYFKSDWLAAFDATVTRYENFTTTDGKVLRVPLMRGVDNRRYAEGGEFLYTELPYVGSEYAMAIVLPSKPGPFPVLTGDRFEKLASSATTELVSVILPRFKVGRRMTLHPMLIGLGFGSAFFSDADFSAMGVASPGRSRLGNVFHEAVIEVDEKGTQAAAATGGMMGPFGDSSPVQRSQPKLVRCDRPFRFFLLHKATGTILFAGRVESPAADPTRP